MILRIYKMSEENFWYLENVNLFDYLCPTKMGNMADHRLMRSFAKGEYIYFPSDPSNRIYFLEKGKVKIGTYSEGGKELIRAILHEGEIFGEKALAGEKFRDDFAIALDDEVKVCSMSLADMKTLMLDKVDFSITLTKQIGNKLLKAERRVESLVFKDARSRILEFLHDQFKEHGEEREGNIYLDDFITHQEIANLTGTSRQTVTTILNELREEKLIDFSRGEMSVSSLAKLRA